MEPSPEIRAPSILSIMRGKRFSGLFITQFLTSFNDNFFKNAIVALINFGYMSTMLTDEEKIMWVIFAGLCFIVPYWLFSATAGKMAEKYDRITIVHVIKFFEVAILTVGGLGFILGNMFLMLSMLFLMGVHSTFFSPIKFGILPTYLHKNELVGGNALIETATFLAIILGTIFGTQIILMQPYGEYISLFIMLFIALIGLWSSYKMPRISKTLPDMEIDFNIFKHNIEVFKIMINAPKVFKYILAGGWFWFVSAVMVMILPVYVSDVIGMNKDVYTILLVIFSVGVGIGSVLCARLLDGNISARFTPVAAIIMGLFALDIGYISEPLFIPLSNNSDLGTLPLFLSQPVAWRIMFDFTIIAAAGGMYVVPFFALVQHDTFPHEKSRMIAGNNIINAFAMVSGGLYMLGTTKIGIPITTIFLVTGGLCFLGALIVHFLIDDSIIKRKHKMHKF